jgi:hypothetical protein
VIAEERRAKQEVRDLQFPSTTRRVISLFQQEEQLQRETARLMVEAKARLQQEVSWCQPPHFPGN